MHHRRRIALSGLLSLLGRPRRRRVALHDVPAGLRVVRDPDAIGIVDVVAKSELLGELVAGVKRVLDNQRTVVLMECGELAFLVDHQVGAHRVGAEVVPV